MEKFSNDNTLLSKFDESATEHLDPFNNEVEIQNLRNQSHLTNFSANNYYSTCFYTENYHNLSDDFSFIFNNDDLINSDSFMKKIPKFHKRHRKENFEKNVPQDNKANDKYFFICKKHRIECKHKIKKIDRNKIRNLLQKDFSKFFGLDGTQLCKKRFLNNFEKLNKNNLIDDYSLIKMIKIKKTKNRNFRLFDKDVILKKIMSNFCKFIKIIFEFFLTMIMGIQQFKMKELDPGNFYTVKQCLEFLRKNKFSEIVETNEKISQSEKIKYNFIFDSNLHEIFSEFFINSDYFFDYVIDKIKSKYDHDYFKSFMNYTSKIIN